MLLFVTRSAALKSLQGAGGAYCLVTAGKKHEVRGESLRGFSEGDNIRVVRPKLDVKVPKTPESNGCSDGANADVSVKRTMGYGVKLTFDLPVRKSVGIITVRACWHDIVFRNSLGFTETMFLY
jgi:hypothetical protein